MPPIRKINLTKLPALERKLPIIAEEPHEERENVLRKDKESTFHEATGGTVTLVFVAISIVFCW